LGEEKTLDEEKGGKKKDTVKSHEKRNLAKEKRKEIYGKRDQGEEKVFKR